ncbi:MAG: NUDIX hydrolase [Gammaproteobacteria bacterium]|nr:NUDIX hydrolase [Gammaproteobacteria bacterium]
MPYRKNGGILEVLLITSRRKKQWIIPKGIKEPHLSPQHSAAKEAFEEAGLVGKVSHLPIGSYKHQRWCNTTCTVKVYCMKVQKMHDKWDEPWRKRKWVPFHTLPDRIQKPELLRVVLKLPDFLQDKPIKWI